MPKLSDIEIRDVFVVPDPKTRLYHLYGSKGLGGPQESPRGFEVRTSPDLMTWSEPRSVLSRTAGPAGADFYWAPEMHFYQGNWYLFGTFGHGMHIIKPHKRHTSIYTAGSLGRPVAPHSVVPLTPLGWSCVDGTLHVDEKGRPWIVFVREWMQTFNGEIHAMPLTPDLKRAGGESALLFRSKEAAWSLPVKTDLGPGYYVTAGPWVHRTAAGELLLLWSTWGKGGYLAGVARSESGLITGPWKQSPEPLFTGDGGHPMIFKTFEGRLMLALHSPNTAGRERARFLPLVEIPGGLALAPVEKKSAQRN